MPDHDHHDEPGPITLPVCYSVDPPGGPPFILVPIPQRDGSWECVRFDINPTTTTVALEELLPTDHEAVTAAPAHPIRGDLAYTGTEPATAALGLAFIFAGLACRRAARRRQLSVQASHLPG